MATEVELAAELTEEMIDAAVDRLGQFKHDGMIDWEEIAREFWIAIELVRRR